MQTKPARLINQTSILLRTEERAFLQAIADRDDVSLAHVIRRAVRFFIAADSANRTMTNGHEPSEHLA